MAAHCGITSHRLPLHPLQELSANLDEERERRIRAEAAVAEMQAQLQRQNVLGLWAATLFGGALVSLWFELAWGL